MNLKINILLSLALSVPLSAGHRNGAAALCGQSLSLSHATREHCARILWPLHWLLVGSLWTQTVAHSLHDRYCI